MYTVEIETENAAPLKTMDILIRFKSDNLTGFKSLFRLNVTLFTLESTSQIVQRPLHSEYFCQNFRDTNFQNLQNLNLDQFNLHEDNDYSHRYTNLNDGLRPKMDSKNNIKYMGLDMIRDIPPEGGVLTREIKAEIEAIGNNQSSQSQQQFTFKKPDSKGLDTQQYEEVNTTDQSNNNTGSLNKGNETEGITDLKHPKDYQESTSQQLPTAQTWPSKPEEFNCQFTKTFKRSELDAVNKSVPFDFELELEFEYAISDSQIFEKWVTEWQKIEKMRRELVLWLSEGGTLEDRGKILLFGDEKLADIHRNV